MNGNNLQPNTNYNPSFTPNFVPNAHQQAANAQARPVPPLLNASDLSSNPSARNLGNYRTNRPPEEEPDTFNLPEYQPIQPGETYMEKLADEAMNSKKLNICLKNAQENEELEDFKDAEEAYEKALKYTDRAEDYKLYASCLSKLSATAKDEATVRVYKEKAAKAFYYLGGLYERNGASKEAHASYRASSELVTHEVPLQALVAVARQVGEKAGIADTLENLADFYTEKGDIDAAIKILEEAIQVEKSFKILQKLEVLCGQAGGKDRQLKVNETRIQQFELQISEDPKNIGLYRKYAWFLKDIGKCKEARVVKARMDQMLQQKLLKQKTKIGDLKQTIHLQAGKLEALGKQVEFLEEQVFSLDFRLQTNIQDADLIYFLNKNPYIKLLNLPNCHNITKAGLAPLKGLHGLTALSLYNGYNLPDAVLKHLEGLTQLTSLNLYNCRQITDAGLQHLARLTRLKFLNLEGTYLTGAGFQHLAHLTQLTELNLYNCTYLTDTGLQHLARLTQLTSLNLGNCRQLTNTGLQHLKGLTQLKFLKLSGIQITDASLQYLAGLIQLAALNLGCTQITDTGLQQLKGLTQLTEFNLSHCPQITDTGLQHLARLPKLRALDLSGCTQITGPAKNNFSRQRPRVGIKHY